MLKAMPIIKIKYKQLAAPLRIANSTRGAAALLLGNTTLNVRFHCMIFP